MTKYVLAGYLILIDLAAFVLFAADKRRAQRKMRRISEAALLWTAALGGSLGALLGMHLFHHKTKHPKFYLLIPALFLLHAAVFAYVFWRIG